MNERQKYLDSEHAEAAELQRFTDQQPDGIHKELLGLLHWQLSKAAKEGKGSLVKDTATAINAVTKSALTQNLLLGQLWSAEERRAFESKLTLAIETILKQYIGDDWIYAMDEIAEEFQRLETETTQVAKTEAPKRITLK